MSRSFQDKIAYETIGGFLRGKWLRLTVPSRMANITAVFLLTSDIGASQVSVLFLAIIEVFAITLSTVRFQDEVGLPL